MSNLHHVKWWRTSSRLYVSYQQITFWILFRFCWKYHICFFKTFIQFESKCQVSIYACLFSTCHSKSFISYQWFFFYMKELMERLSLKETIVEVVKRSSLRWMGHVLRRDKDEPVKRVWNLEIAGKRERGRPKMTWKDMVKKESRKIGLDERDAQDRKKWRAGIATWKEWKLRGKKLTIINDDDDLHPKAVMFKL